jgi:hypothetical protein
MKNYGSVKYLTVMVAIGVLFDKGFFQNEIIQILHRVNPEVLDSDIDRVGITKGQKRRGFGLPLGPEDSESRTVFWTRGPIGIKRVDKVN